MARSKKVVAGIISIIMILGMFGTVYAAEGKEDYLYFKEKIKVSQAKVLLKNKNLLKSYIVVLDTGIQEDYYTDFYGSLIAGARSIPGWGTYHGNPWTSYTVGSNHGTEVQWIIDELIYSLNINNKVKQPIMTIQYKLADAYGSSTGERLLYALNDIMKYYVAEQKMNIVAINYSNGLTFGTPANKKESDAQNKLKKDIQSAIDKAASLGITFVAAAGNTNTKISSYSANLKNVLVVGASDVNDKRGSWINHKGKKEGSCYGSQLDVVAPAVKISVFDYKKDQYMGSGTSYATPMVATAVAVLKSVNPKLKPATIESILKSTANEMGAKGRDDDFGYGLIDLEKAIKKAIATK
jgi:hypothetical protein